MDNLSNVEKLLRCTGCRSGRLAATADRQAFVCSACGHRFRIVNAVPCFVADDRAGYSEVAPENRAGFLAAKSVAYFARSPVSSMYNHYHQYAAGVRLAVGRQPRTLDIGFGIGEHVPCITAEERQAGSFVGVDLDRFKLEYFSAIHPDVPVLQADGFNLPFADNCMEVVQLLAVLEHFSPEEIDRLLDEAVRTLLPGGTLIICYPAEGGCMLRVCQFLMHALIRFKTGFDLEKEAVHRHLATAAVISTILGKRGALKRTDRRIYPFNIPWMSLALFVNETYRKVEES